MSGERRILALRSVSRDVGSCMGCTRQTDGGRIDPEATVIEFSIGSLWGRVCDDCLDRLEAALKKGRKDRRGLET